MKTRLRELNVIGIDPTRFRVDGKGYWRDDEGRVFEDAVLVLQSREDAYWVSFACGQVCFLHLSFVREPNGYLLELPEKELESLFRDGKISGFTVLTRRLDESVPKSFTVLSADEAEAVGAETLTPVHYEFVYVKLPPL
jgi:hypothetical protein